MPVRSLRLIAAAAAMLAVAGCQDETRTSSGGRHWVPVSAELTALMTKKEMAKDAPVLIRSFKKESEFEIWKQGKDGRFALLKTYPMCRWSGQLGPKVKQGDRQAPEGFYAIAPAQMNPNSSFHLSFNMGYPNAFDREHGRNGDHLMVHGACSSAGCYSMTDKQVEEIYALVREAHSGGQRAVQMQALPFRMTAENLAKHRHDPHIGFWSNLKEGADLFEVTKQEPKVAVCNKRYAFGAEKAGEGACPALDTSDELKDLIAEKRTKDDARVAELVSKGSPALRVLYADGGQHPSFRGTQLAYAGATSEERPTGFFSAPRPAAPVTQIADVSRPEALEVEPQLIPVGPGGKLVGEGGKAAPGKPVTAIASVTKPAAKSPAIADPAETKLASGSPKADAPEAKLADAGPEPFHRRAMKTIGLGGASEQKPIAIAAEGKAASLPAVAEAKPAVAAAPRRPVEVKAGNGLPVVSKPADGRSPDGKSPDGKSPDRKSADAKPGARVDEGKPADGAKPKQQASTPQDGARPASTKAEEPVASKPQRTSAVTDGVIRGSAPALPTTSFTPAL